MLPIKNTVKQLTGLLAATNIIAQAPNLADGLQRLAEKMAEDLKTSFCRVFLFDEGQQVLVAKAAHAILDEGDAPNWKPGLGEPTPVSEWEGLSETLAEGNPILLKITGKRSRPVLEAWSERLGLGREIQSLLVLPLRTKGRTLGLLDLGQLRRWEDAPFTEEKKELAAAIAEQAAVLIDLVRLHESTEDRMGQLAALNERLHLREQEALVMLSKELLQRQSLQDALNAAVKVAKEALGADLANIVLEEQSGELVFAAQLGWEGVEVGKTRVASEGSMTGFTLRERQPVRVDDYDREHRFTVLNLVRGNHLASGMSVPMLSGDEVVGTMAVHTLTPHRFSDAEQNLLSLIANQTAIAIKSARQEKERTRLRAVNEASKAISRSSSGFERGRVLKQIVEEAVNCIADRRGRKSYLGIIQLYKPSTNELFFESASLPDELNCVMNRIGSPRVLDRSLGKIGITGRAALIRQPQLVPDVGADADYLMISDRIRSAVAVPLLSGDEVAGVIDLESERPDAFDEDDLETLQALAELAVIAVQNAKQFEELKQTKVEVGWRTALAWMGMTSNVWRHTVNSKTLNIKEQSSFLGEDLEGELTPAGLARIKKRVTMIERMAGEIVEEPTLPPLSTPEAVSSVPVNQVVRERVMRLWQREPYSSVGLKQFDLALPGDAKIRANSDWLHRALDVLVDNAVEAVAGCERREISIATRAAQGNAEILVSDSGRGIPGKVRDKLLKEQIERSPPVNGRGVGLLIARAIINSYKGDLRVGATSREGTTMIIALPLET